jgi:hypothetical protein
MEIKIRDGSNLLIGCHYFPPDTKIYLKITYCNFILFADINIFHRITSIDNCFLLQSNINSVKNWCTENYIKIRAAKRKVILFSRKSNMLTFKYEIFNSDTLNTDCIKDLGVFLHSKLCSHQHVDYLFSHTIQLLGQHGLVLFPFLL